MRLKRMLIISILALLSTSLSLAAKPKSKSKAKSKFHFTIQGIKKPLLTNAQERIKVILDTSPPHNRHQLKMTYRTAFKEIKQSLKPFGYFHAKVSGQLHYKGDQANAIYQVDKGKAIHITQVNLTISGNGQFNSKVQKAKKHFLLKPGQVLSVPNYQKARSVLINQVRRQGYTFANLTTDKVKIDLINNTVVMTFNLDTGPRFYFGTTSMNKIPLSPVFLRRFLNYEKGQPFNPNKLTNLQNTYGDTGYFKSVTIIPAIPDKASNTKKRDIPVDIKFKMAPKHLYQIGTGYGTVTRFRVNGAVKWRWVNSSGDKLSTSGYWSKEFYELQSQYLIPSKTPSNAYYTINGSAFIINPQETSKAYVAKFGPGYLVQKGKWTYETTLYYLYEKWRLHPNDRYTYSHLILPQFSMTHLSQKNVVQVENGSKLQLTFSGALKPIYSSLTYFQPQINYKIIRTVGTGNRFILSTIDGFTIGKDLDQLPLSERFFAGGPNNLLGFDFQGIGPGRYLTVANAAYQRKVYGSIYGEVFYNIGNAFDSFQHYTANLNKSTGIAVVWRTPVGDLSVYWAKVLSLPHHPNRFGFMLGPEL